MPQSNPYNATWDHLLAVQAEHAKMPDKDTLRHDGYKLLGAVAFESRDCEIQLRHVKQRKRAANKAEREDNKQLKIMEGLRKEMTINEDEESMS